MEFGKVIITLYFRNISEFFPKDSLSGSTNDDIKNYINSIFSEDEYKELKHIMDNHNIKYPGYQYQGREYVDFRNAVENYVKEFARRYNLKKDKDFYIMIDSIDTCKVTGDIYTLMAEDLNHYVLNHVGYEEVMYHFDAIIDRLIYENDYTKQLSEKQYLEYVKNINEQVMLVSINMWVRNAPTFLLDLSENNELK